jgi:hypothetical protein
VVGCRCTRRMRGSGCLRSCGLCCQRQSRRQKEERKGANGILHHRSLV